MKLSVTYDTTKAGRYAKLGSQLCGCCSVTKAGKKKLVGTPKAFKDWLDATVPGFAERIHDFLKARGKELADHVRDELKHHTHKLSKADMSDEEILAALDSYNWDSWDALVGVVNDDLYETYLQRATEQLRILGVVADDSIVNQLDERALSYAAGEGAYLVGKKVLEDGSVVDNPSADYAITDATRDSLRSLVTDAVEQGMSTDELATAIQDSHSFSEERATTIARTELAAAHVEGNMEGWKVSGLVSMKISILGSEHGEDDTDECDDNAEAGAIPLEDEFPSGDVAPPYHPNCICDVAPVLAEDVSDSE